MQLLVLSLLSCSKDDPRCAVVAKNIASFAVSSAGEQLEADDPRLAQLTQQASLQIAKVQAQCITALGNDKEGGVSLWVDCMAAATSAEDATECRSVGTRPEY